MSANQLCISTPIYLRLLVTDVNLLNQRPAWRQLVHGWRSICHVKSENLPHWTVSWTKCQIHLKSPKDAGGTGPGPSSLPFPLNLPWMGVSTWTRLVLISCVSVVRTQICEIRDWGSGLSGGGGALGGDGFESAPALAQGFCGVEHSRIAESTGAYKRKSSDEKHGFLLHSPKYIRPLWILNIRLKNHWPYKLTQLCEPSDLAQTEKSEGVSIQHKSRRERCSRLLLSKTLQHEEA